MGAPPTSDRAAERRPAPQADPLTERELEVLHLVARGLSNREIAQELVLAVTTVKKHASNIYGKLGVHSRIQAVARAQELGLL
jgi:LuxR family maltose regulon positive regulatory protein